MALISNWVNSVEPTQVKTWHSSCSLESLQELMYCNVLYGVLELLVLMSNDEVYSGAVLAEGEWQLLCINRIPCSLGQMHGAVTAAFESAVWKCYQLDRVSEQKEWGISAWLSRLNYPGLIRKGIPEQLSALSKGRWVWIFRWKWWFSWIRFGSGCCFL